MGGEECVQKGREERGGRECVGGFRRECVAEEGELCGKGGKAWRREGRKGGKIMWEDREEGDARVKIRRVV